MARDGAEPRAVDECQGRAIAGELELTHSKAGRAYVAGARTAQRLSGAGLADGDFCGVDASGRGFSREGTTAPYGKLQRISTLFLSLSEMRCTETANFLTGKDRHWLVGKHNNDNLSPDANAVATPLHSRRARNLQRITSLTMEFIFYQNRALYQ